MSLRIYIEGGGDSKELNTRCREGFRRLLENCGFRGRMPRLIACGSRQSTVDDFSTAHQNAGHDDYVAMLIDSEDPIQDIDQTWDHLKKRDGWKPVEGAHDAQVLLMTTCMETWIVSDHETLRKHFGSQLREKALPPLHAMETRSRHDVSEALKQATKDCKAAYTKSRGFQIVAKLNPSVLAKHLPCFRRFKKILADRLSDCG